MFLDFLRAERFLLESQPRPPCPRTAAAFWQELRDGGSSSPALASCLCDFEPRSRLVEATGVLHLIPDDPAARPRLRWLLGQAPAPGIVRLGWPGWGHETALAFAQREGAPLGGLRVRVGIGKGHVFDLVLGVPIDEDFDPEALEDAIIDYLECRLGETFVDDWLGEILFERIPSRRGLAVVTNAGLPNNYALKDLADLALRGALGLLLGRREGGEESWVAFELGEEGAQGSPQPGRSFATTCVPEALGPIFEGIPFTSRRFFEEGERLVCFEWRPSSTDRTSERRRLEEQLDELVRRLGTRGVVGTGFGSDTDYVDLVIPFRIEALRQLAQFVQNATSDGRFRFYDSEHRELTLEGGAMRPHV